MNKCKYLCGNYIEDEKYGKCNTCKIADDIEREYEERVGSEW